MTFSKGENTGGVPMKPLQSPSLVTGLSAYEKCRLHSENIWRCEKYIQDVQSIYL